MRAPAPLCSPRVAAAIPFRTLEQNPVASSPPLSQGDSTSSLKSSLLFIRVGALPIPQKFSRSSRSMGSNCTDRHSQRDRWQLSPTDIDFTRYSAASRREFAMEWLRLDSGVLRLQCAIEMLNKRRKLELNRQV